MTDPISVAVAKRLTAFRLQALRTLALRALESHYTHLPTDVRTALHAVVDAILKAEEACVVWVYVVDEEKDDKK